MFSIPKLSNFLLLAAIKKHRFSASYTWNQAFWLANTDQNASASLSLWECQNSLSFNRTSPILNLNRISFLSRFCHFHGYNLILPIGMSCIQLSVLTWIKSNWSYPSMIVLHRDKKARKSLGSQGPYRSRDCNSCDSISSSDPFKMVKFLH